MTDSLEQPASVPFMMSGQPLTAARRAYSGSI